MEGKKFGLIVEETAEVSVAFEAVVDAEVILTVLELEELEERCVELAVEEGKRVVDDCDVAAAAVVAVEVDASELAVSLEARVKGRAVEAAVMAWRMSCLGSSAWRVEVSMAIFAVVEAGRALLEELVWRRAFCVVAASSFFSALATVVAAETATAAAAAAECFVVAFPFHSHFPCAFCCHSDERPVYRWPT